MGMRRPETLKVTSTWGIMRKNHHPLLPTRCLMTSSVSPIVQQIQQDFQALLAFVSGPQAHTQTAYTVELTLFRRLLALGAALLRLFFLRRAAARPPHPSPLAAVSWPITIAERSPTTRSSANSASRATTSTRRVQLVSARWMRR
jgi:hypothetical protein